MVVNLLSNVKNKSEFAFYVKSHGNKYIIAIKEGTGDNLLKSDINDGYIDYFDIEKYAVSDCDITAEDGGMCLLEDRFDAIPIEIMIENALSEMDIAPNSVIANCLSAEITPEILEEIADNDIDDYIDEYPSEIKILKSVMLD